VSRLYLYAIVWRTPSAPLGLGLSDEPLTLVTAGDVVAVVGEVEEPPEATSESVRGHDAVVRRVAEACEGILPARFGTVQDPPELADWLAAAAPGLADALRLVAGREQMTLHVFDADAAPASAAAEEPRVDAAGLPLGPGARYLAARRRHWQQRESLPELAPLRPRLDGLVVAERVEHRATPPFRASVYHLIERGRSAAYRQAVETHRELLVSVRLRVSGPLAPYAFAPAVPQ
jgi:Gas vesicle synthesis protein GvpL/GvpF